ncbi:MAG: hypothetical protein GY926_04720 [bacterium]|nr:hypothetical protein [bacterium]
MNARVADRRRADMPGHRQQIVAHEWQLARALRDDETTQAWPLTQGMVEVAAQIERELAQQESVLDNSSRTIWGDSTSSPKSRACPT